MEHLTQVSIMYFDFPNKHYNYWKSTKQHSRFHDNKGEQISCYFNLKFEVQLLYFFKF